MNPSVDHLPAADVAEVKCDDCGRLFLARLFVLGKRSLHVRLCPTCIGAKEVGQELLRLAEREHAWQCICPRGYATCDPAKLPSVASRQAYDLALRWSPAEGGLVLVGRASGQGKSRLVHAAARRHFLDGQSVATVNCATFGLEVASRFDWELRDWLKPLRRVGILILDDLGKELADRRVAAAVYHLVEERTAQGRPILITTNYNGDELAARLGEQGPYVVRRLREFCQTCLL